MKSKTIVVIFAALTLAACGPGKQDTPREQPRVEAVKPSGTLPNYDSVGVISSLNGQVLTLDHDGASAAALVPGRDDFIVHADLLAEAPITPGARVAFSFHRTSDGLELTALKAR